MRIIYIPFFLLAVVLLVAPLAVAAQMAGAQTTQAEVTEAAALRQVAVQLEEIEGEVNRLTLLVTKLALERQAVDLERQIAALYAPKGDAPLAIAQEEQNPSSSEVVMKEEQAVESSEDIFAQIDIDDSSADGKDGEFLMSRKEDEKESVFAAGLSSIKSIQNMGTPQLAALTILALLAIFVLVRRFRGRKQESKGAASIPSPVGGSSTQTLSQPQQDLLQEGRQELKENVVWK